MWTISQRTISVILLYLYMKNIRFHYLYRDVANYKNFNSIILINDLKMRFLEIDGLINSHLIAGSYFYANEWRLPDLHFGTWDNEFDHNFHEFECIENTDDISEQVFLLSEFKALLEQTNLM